MKRRLRIVSSKLNKPYKSVNDKPIVKIAELTGILPALGLFYLWIFFDSLGINYFLYFNITDAIAVLYQNLMSVIFIGVILSPALMTFLIPDFLKRKKGVSILSMLIISIILICGLWVLFSVYQFTNIVTIIFLGMTATTTYIYLFVNRNLGFWMILGIAFIYIFATAKQEAKYTITKKSTFNIILKEYSDKPILIEKDKFRYFIFKTSNYYFIKNERENLIYAYSVSSGEMTSFTPKK